MGKLMVHGKPAGGVVDKAENLGIDTIDGMSAQNCQDALSELNSNLDELGECTELGTITTNGTISLSDSIDNYRYIGLAIRTTISGSSRVKWDIVPTQYLKQYNSNNLAYFLSLFYNTTTFSSVLLYFSSSTSATFSGGYTTGFTFGSIYIIGIK